jgi:integrase
MTKVVSKLRQAMIDAMLLRGYAVRTHQSYLGAVADLAKYYNRSPALLSTDEVQAYFLYLVKERQLAPATCRLSLNGIRFLFKEVLHREFETKIHVPKRPQRIPELLTRTEVGAILACCLNPKHRMLLTVCYGCGLRVSELLYLKVRDIDSERLLLRIDQGKGAKDRNVEMPKTLVLKLRDYWRLFRPYDWLFPGRDPHSGSPAPRSVSRRPRPRPAWTRSVGSTVFATPTRPINWRRGCRSPSCNISSGIRIFTPPCVTSIGYRTIWAGIAVRT